MSNEYRNNTPPERVQIGPRAAQEANQSHNTGGLVGSGKRRDNMADVIISRELDALVCLASQVEETAQRRLAPVSFGFPTSPEEPTKHQQLPPLFNNYHNQIERALASLKRTHELIASVQISEP